MKRDPRMRWPLSNVLAFAESVPFVQTIRRASLQMSVDYDTSRSTRKGKQKEADLSTHPFPSYRAGLLLSFCSVNTHSVALALRDYFVQLEDRQEHRNHDAADDDAKKNDQEWFDQRSEGVEHRFDFFVPEIRHLFQHRVDFTRSFTRRNHAEHHGRENRLFRKSDRKIVAFFDVLTHALDTGFNDVIAGSAGDNVDDFENWNTTADQLRKSARRTGTCKFCE